MTRILVVSDTHVPDHARTLPDALLRAADRADLILHPGSPTWKRRQPVPTFAILDVRARRIRASIHPVEGPS